MSFARILVAGAGGAVGLEIVRLLRTRGANVLASYRTDREELAETLHALGAETLRLDFEDEAALAGAMASVDAAILTPILSVSKKAAAFLEGGKRALFFSSNNVAIDPDDAIYAALKRAEAETLEAAGALILRPTMIYGYPGDGNIGRLMTAMRRSPLIPLPGGGRALQQPIYYRDLARIAVDVLFNREGAERVLTVSGPEPMTQRALYDAVAHAVGASPAITPIPVGLLAPVMAAIEKLGVRAPVKAAQLRRAGWDKLPKDAPILKGETPFAEGARRLAAALDDIPPGA